MFLDKLALLYAQAYLIKLALNGSWRDIKKGLETLVDRFYVAGHTVIYIDGKV